MARLDDAANPVRSAESPENPQESTRIGYEVAAAMRGLAPEDAGGDPSFRPMPRHSNSARGFVRPSSRNTGPRANPAMATTLPSVDFTHLHDSCVRDTTLASAHRTIHVMPNRSGWDTTRWSLVLAAGGTYTSAARTALAELCEVYWYPLYAFARAQGLNADDAADIVQGFLASLIERDDLAAVDPNRGRFRAFLLASLKHFIANARARDRRQKRGAGQPSVSLAFDAAEERFQHEPADTRTPESLYERAWASALFETVFRRIEGEWSARGKRDEFRQLKDCLMGDAPTDGYAEVARDLGATEAAVKMAVHRMKRRFLAELRAEVAETTSDEQVDEELQYLLRALQH